MAGRYDGNPFEETSTLSRSKRAVKLEVSPAMAGARSTCRTDSALKFGLSLPLSVSYSFLCIFCCGSSCGLEESLWHLVLCRGILPAIDLISRNALVGIFYFVGFGLFCLESLLSIWLSSECTCTSVEVERLLK
ncbi:hypothetical protein GUJ93_ZPchr0007g5643 [Zizania palustris]|uniref:Secretory carrier-associated membrane protein n=1 Tax=Zizania palustris TaxID=103762 RepID=A0A8J5TE63_ZIZPA|nr:hypothetical protein GUJ93_ZPchr0007g5643 [Zizania palustris]